MTTIDAPGLIFFVANSVDAIIEIANRTLGQPSSVMLIISTEIDGKDRAVFASNIPVLDEQKAILLEALSHVEFVEALSDATTRVQPPPKPS